MRGLIEILATIVAGVAILAVAVYFFLGDAPPPGGDTIVQMGPGAPDAGGAPPARAPSAGAPAPAPSLSAANAPRVLVPSDPGEAPAGSVAPPTTAPADTLAAPATDLAAPEGYVAVEDQLAPARDVGGGLVTGAAPVRVGPIVRLQKAPEVTTAIPEPAPIEPRRFFRVVVADAGTIIAGDQTLRLADVDVPAADAECGDGSGNRWSCGTRARTALRRFVRHRAVECLPLGESGFGAEAGVHVVRCRVGRTDLATWLVENGWAAPADAAAPALAALGDAARSGNRGLWQTEPVGLDEPDDEAADAAADSAATPEAAGEPVPLDPLEAAPGQ
jgi:endonuclease YncB( thermonuclease family)